jgi:periplasmic divalent cation tolerance protein
MTGKLVVFVTCANAREAQRIARTLVEERLAACVNIHQTAVQSVYRWKGKVEKAREILLVIKSSGRLFSCLERRVRELHSYDTPEIIALPITTGSRPYLAWIDNSLGETRRIRERQRKS